MPQMDQLSVSAESFQQARYVMYLLVSLWSQGYSMVYSEVLENIGNFWIQSHPELEINWAMKTGMTALNQRNVQGWGLTCSSWCLRETHYWWWILIISTPTYLVKAYGKIKKFWVQNCIFLILLNQILLMLLLLIVWLWPYWALCQII